MKVYLIKKNRKTIDVVVIKMNDTFIESREGKVNQTLSSPSTQNLGTIENAEKFMQEIIAEYQKKGFVISKERPNYIEFKTLDKAEWHFNGDFPKELDIYQGYVHTGMFIGWLIEHDLINEEFNEEFVSEISMVKKKEITPTKFFEDFLDGVFSNDIIIPSAIDFVEKYYAEQYSSDYETALGDELPSLYYVRDTWDNYNKIAEVITKRYTSQ